MVYRFAFTYLGLLYAIILCLIYFAKQEFHETRNKLYKMLIIETIISCSLDALFSIFIGLKLDFFAGLLFKVYWFSIAFWTVIEYLYIYTVINDVKDKGLRDVFEANKGILITFLILEFVTVIAAGPDLNKDSIIFCMDSMFMMICIGLIVLLHSINVINSAKKGKSVSIPTRKIILLSPIILLISLIIQMFYSDASFISLGYVIVVYALFFINENPDVEILNKLNASNLVLDKKAKVKSNFLYNINDGILESVDSMSELVENLYIHNDYNEIRSNINLLINKSNNILDSINNILINSNINASGDIIQEKEYNLYDIIKDNINKINRKIDKSQVKFIVNVSPNLSTILLGDADRLNQIIYNLLSNAAKYTTIGRIEFNIASKKSNNIEYLVFEVSDTGCGIKDEDKPKIFNYVDPTTNRGFSLYSTKKSVELLGGKIWFESIYLAGASFFVQIPQKIVDPTPISMTANDKTINNTQLDCSKYKALIVENNELNAKVLAKLLSKYNFEIEIVNSGKTCIYNIKSEKKYDIILINYLLPDIDGLTVLKTLKQLSDYSLPPIVSVSANVVVGVKERHLKAGFDDYLLKPYSKKELNRIINKFFNK